MARLIAIVAAIIGGAGWIAKILIMWAAGGPDEDSIPESVAFFVGLIGVPIAGAAAGWILSRGAAQWMRVLALVAGFLAPLVVVGVVQAGLAAAMPDEGWFRDEVVFLLVGAVALVLGVVALAMQPRGPARQRA